MGYAGLMLAAWVAEGLFGYPERLYRRIRHPVVWMGTLIDWLDRMLNRPAARHTLNVLLGLVATLVTAGLAAAAAASSASYRSRRSRCSRCSCISAVFSSHRASLAAAISSPSALAKSWAWIWGSGDRITQPVTLLRVFIESTHCGSLPKTDTEELHLPIQVFVAYL